MADVCRKYGISYAAVYKYKTTYGGVIGTLVEWHYIAPASRRRTVSSKVLTLASETNA